jgi:Protein of unknown function (DUF5818)
MTKTTLMLALALLASTSWLLAQNQDSPTRSGQNGTAGQTTIQGCLQESHGSYTLTSDSGMTYLLQGASSTLSKHVGHEVRITGSTSSAGSSRSETDPAAGTSEKPQETLTIENVKHISKTCSNTAK